MSGKKLTIEANLYTVEWMHDEAHGFYRERHRILSTDAEDAINETRPLKMYNAKLIRADLLFEGLEIPVSAKTFQASWSDSNLPYHDKEVKELLKAKSVD